MNGGKPGPSGSNLTQKGGTKQRTIQERLRYKLGRSNLELTGELESKV
jgi:hypothetical protein